MVKKYAQIVDGKVENIAVFKYREDAINITKAIYGQDAEAVNVEYIDVDFGDTYRDKTFYRVNEDGTETQVEHIPTESQRITTVESVQDQITLALADLIGA